MKTALIATTTCIALAVFVPAALAGSSDASSTDASTTTSTSPAATTPAATTPTAATDTTPTTTTATDAAAPSTTTTTTTTDDGVPVTVGDAPSTTTTTTTDAGVDIGDLDTDIPADVGAANTGACVDATCVAGAGGIVPAGAVGSGALPFTGIKDMVAPVLLALVVLLAGVVAIRWAQLREAVARHGSRRVIDGAALVSKTGYAAAMREQTINNRARSFYGPRVA